MTDVNPLNPYQAPPSSTVPPAPNPGARNLGPALPWTPTEAVTFGWNSMKREPMCIVIFFVASLVGGLISAATSIVNQILQMNSDPDLHTVGWVIYGVGIALSIPLQIWVQMGLVRYFLAASRRVPGAGFGDVFRGGPFLGYLGASLLVGLGVFLGGLACIVPAFILVTGWYMFSCLMIDRGLGAIESIKTSWAITNGHKVNLFLYMLLSLGIVLLGYLACCVGAFVAFPVVQFGVVYIYLKLIGEEPPVPT